MSLYKYRNIIRKKIKYILFTTVLYSNHISIHKQYFMYVRVIICNFKESHQFLLFTEDARNASFVYIIHAQRQTQLKRKSSSLLSHLMIVNMTIKCTLRSLDMIDGLTIFFLRREAIGNDATAFLRLYLCNPLVTMKS